MFELSLHFIPAFSALSFPIYSCRSLSSIPPLSSSFFFFEFQFAMIKSKPSMAADL